MPKKKKQDILRNKKMIAVQTEYANALTYIEMFHSVACWHNTADAKTKYELLNSRAAKMDAMKEQSRIHVVGFRWKDLHHPWSKNGKEFSPDELFEHLIEKIIPEQLKQGIPNQPTMELPFRKDTPKLGTKTADVENLEGRYEAERTSAIEAAEKLREQLETDGAIDRYEKLQPSRPEVDEQLIGLEIEQLWIYEEEDGEKVPQWCQGVVVAIKNRSKVHIQWNKNCLRNGDLPITEEALMRSKFNKHVEGGWRMS